MMAIKNIVTISERVPNQHSDPIKMKTMEKMRRKPEPRWFVKSFNDFCNATALHGYIYIVRKDASTCERVTWSFIVVLAMVCAVLLLGISWSLNAENPTTTVIENTHYATWNVPFPAVTICNMNKISAAAALKVATEMTRPANISAPALSLMFKLVLHFEGIGQATNEEYAQLNSILRQNGYTVPQLMHAIAPKCTDMLERCMWKGTQTRCDNLFQDVNSTEGVCCSFNNHALAQSKFSQKLVHSIPKYPRKVTACGYQTGLTVLARPFVDDYHSTFLSSTGFRIFIHNSYDFPDDNAETKYVSSLTEAFVTINPESTYSTPGIRTQSVENRQCYFSDEQPLNVMQKYTYVNCMSECRSNLMLSMCDCIPYNYPNNGSADTCELSKMGCIQKYKSIFNAALPGTNFSAATLADTDCVCLPDCELLQYMSEITTGRLNRDFSFNSMTFFKDVILDDQTLIHVYFNDLVSTLYRKDLTQNWLGLLASFGGLLGLMLGFSSVTGFELVYFFTLRPFFDHLMKRRNAQKVVPSGGNEFMLN